MLDLLTLSPCFPRPDPGGTAVIDKHTSQISDHFPVIANLLDPQKTRAEL